MGPEARYFKNAVVIEDSSRPFYSCKTLGSFLRKVEQICKMREMGYGIPRNKAEWFLYAPSSDLYPHEECIHWRMQEEQTMNLFCIGNGKIEDNIRLGLLKLIKKDPIITFGIFAADTRLGKRLRSKWAKRDFPENITLTDEIYDEIIDARMDAEISIFIYINKNLKPTDFQKHILSLNSIIENKLKTEELQSLKETAAKLIDCVKIDSDLFEKNKIFLKTWELNKGLS